MSGPEVEATYYKRSPDRWAFDVMDDLGIVCSVPAASSDDDDARQLAERIAALLGTDAAPAPAVPVEPAWGSVADLRDRLERARRQLDALADDTSDNDEATRLAAKASGVALALSYVNEMPALAAPSPAEPEGPQPEPTDGDMALFLLGRIVKLLRSAERGVIAADGAMVRQSIEAAETLLNQPHGGAPGSTGTGGEA